jgi:protein kinase A
MRIYEQIVAGHIRFPSATPPAARSLIKALCTVNPSERLGFISGGSQRVKEHEFFASVDWDSLYYRRIKGPIIPRVDHPADTGNFDDYDEPKAPGERSIYTKEMQHSHEDSFKDF